MLIDNPVMQESKTSAHINDIDLSSSGYFCHAQDGCKPTPYLA